MDQAITAELKDILTVFVATGVVTFILGIVFATRFWKRKILILKQEHKDEIIEKNYLIRELRTGTPIEEFGAATMAMPDEQSPLHPQHPKYGLKSRKA